MALEQWASARKQPLPRCESAPPAERRRTNGRLFTLLRTGKLFMEGREAICRVRNVSPNGFMADACPAPGVGEAVTLYLAEDQPLGAAVAWSQGERFGAEFAQPQSIETLLGRRGPERHFRNRAIRIQPDGGYATVICGDQTINASIVNISQTGMAVAASGLWTELPTCRELRADIDGLGPMKGVLCWSGEGRAGIRFAEPISFGTLGHWLWAVSLATRQFAPRF